jgi:hypothetical protein
VCSSDLYYPLGGPFRYLAPRFSASGGYVPDDSGNIYGTALVELIPALRLSDSPWANLGIPLDLVYEGSKISRMNPYYAADQALTAKGGLLWQASFAGKDGNALALSLEGQSGLYEMQTFSAASEDYLYMYVSLRLDWLRRDVTYSISAEASSSSKEFGGSPKYWSFSLMGGISAKQPALIAP